jgi:hypothetical protein
MDGRKGAFQSVEMTPWWCKLTAMRALWLASFGMADPLIRETPTTQNAATPSATISRGTQGDFASMMASVEIRRLAQDAIDLRVSVGFPPILLLYHSSMPSALSKLEVLCLHLGADHMMLPETWN